MIKLSLTRVAVAVGSLALSLTAGAGVASADPDLDPIVNTTCNYGQVMAALNAADPAAAAAWNSSPANGAMLQQFLASSPDQRLKTARMLRSQPAAQQYYGLIQQVVATCNNF